MDWRSRKARKELFERIDPDTRLVLGRLMQHFDEMSDRLEMLNKYVMMRLPPDGDWPPYKD